MSQVLSTTGSRSAAVSYSFAKAHGVVVSEVTEFKATVHYRPPLSARIAAELKRTLGVTLELKADSEDEFNRNLALTYDRGTEGADQVMEEFNDEYNLQQIANALPQAEDLLEAEDDAPIIRLINALLSQAIKVNASDIHIETFEARMEVRFRVDGLLHVELEPPRKLAPIIVSRIKVMARLDIAERRLPQDGRMSVRVAGREVDVRVSTLPSGYGERVVLRILDKQAGHLSLEELGMSNKTLALTDEIIHKPHGIILVTGPTGSGKSTTLYAALSRLNNKQRNILTVEDPIEYFIDGIGQTQVNTKVDMSFARGLRAILRQDPDVVMVGEIRDLETAQIAVQASLTGHTVLSTIHTNTAVGAITRLRDMGIVPFLLSSSLLGIYAQRLVRVLCNECKDGYEPDEALLRRMRIQSTKENLFYAPRGCAKCKGTGYNGRTGIYEMVMVDDELRRMIHDGAGEHELEEHARTLTPSIAADGRRRVAAGTTSVEEVMRVTVAKDTV